MADGDRCCRLVELRQYTLHPGRRDTLVSLFDREFVGPQTEAGMHVIGQFRDLGDPDRFVWLRGFVGEPQRSEALHRFYYGPVWRQHRDEANSTMVDSDDVLLLEPAAPGEGLCHPPPEPAATGTLVTIVVRSVEQDPGEPAVAAWAADERARLIGLGAQPLGCYRTSAVTNGFPALPIRTGEHVLVSIARVPDYVDAAPHTGGASTTLRLAATGGSALR